MLSLKKRLENKQILDFRPVFFFVVIPIVLIVGVSFWPDIPNEHPWSDLSFFIIVAIFIVTLLLFYTIDELKGLHAISEEKFPNPIHWKFDETYDELRIIERIGYVAIPAMIIFAIIAEIGFYLPDVWNAIFAPLFDGLSVQKVRMISTVLLVFYIGILFFFFIGPSSFLRFYLAKISFEYTKIGIDRVEKMKCYKNGFNYYNRFLAKTLHIQLDDMKIYSKILSTDSINVMELHSYFVCDNKLNPIKYFA